MGCRQAVADPQSLLGPRLLAWGPLDVVATELLLNATEFSGKREGLVILLCLGPRLGLLGNGDPRFLRWLAGGLIF